MVKALVDCAVDAFASGGGVHPREVFRRAPAADAADAGEDADAARRARLVPAVPRRRGHARAAGDARIEVGRTPLVTLAPGRVVRAGLGWKF